MSQLLRRLVPAMDPRALGLLRVLLACALAVELWHGRAPFSDNGVAVALAWVAVPCFALGYRTAALHWLLWLGFAMPALLDNMQRDGAHRFLALPHLLAWTVLLPAGARLSIDALRASMGAREEYVAADLADRGAMRVPASPGPAWVELWGWLSMLFGIALHASAAREVVMPHLLVAALLLLLPRPWMLDALGARLAPRLGSGRRLECFFDAGCGICFQLARLLARLDRFERVELLSNRDTERLPEGVTGALIEETIVVRDVERGRVHTRAEAIAVLCRALPLGLPAWALLSLPGLGWAWGALYDLVARNRVRISTALGLAACKIPPRVGDGSGAAASRQG